MSVSANRTQVAYVVETTAGTTPNTPRMRTVRMTGEQLAFAQDFVDSDEVRADRMIGDPILVMKSSGGTLNFEWSYPVDQTFLSDLLRSTFYASWVNTPQRDNDGTADSVITDVATSGVITVTTGAAFVIGHLIKTTGFGQAGNNGTFRITTGSATVPSVGAALLTAEGAPAAAARVKVVGAAGVSGDITATATGLGSTTLDFTTLGLAVGQWIKIGGTATANRFATAALNGYARMTAIAATALTLDNRPTGWTTDAGTGKLIWFFFGDQIRNSAASIVRTSMTIEKGFLGQTVPNYIVGTGETVGQLAATISSRQKITGTATFMGQGGSTSTTALDASIDAATTNAIMAANANVGRINEAGATLVGPNFIRDLNFTINNNLRTVEDVAQQSPTDIVEGEFTVTGTINTYFGDSTLLTKFYNNTATALNVQIAKNNQGIIFSFPRVTYRGGGNPQATAKNTDVMASFDFSASIDSTTGSHCLIDRMEYVEA